MGNQNETLTIESQDDIYPSEKVSPVHQSMRDLMDSVTWNGLTHAQKNTMLRNTFPVDYRRTRKHWETKLSNARQQGYEVTEDFRIFWAFLYMLGPKPPLGEYQIHRKDNDEGYSLVNCVWLGQDANLKQRGMAQEIRDYCKRHNVSRATAYRHFKEEEPPFNPEYESQKTRAEKFHHMWWELIAIHHPTLFVAFPHIQRMELRQIEVLIQKCGHIWTRKRLGFAISNWKELQGMINSTWGKNYSDIGSLPDLSNFLRFEPRIQCLASELAHRKFLAAAKDTYQEYPF